MHSVKKVHLDIQTHRKNPYGVLRSYEKNPDGTTSRKTIARLNHLSLSQLHGIRDALQGKTVSKSDFIIKSGKEYGASFACLEIAKEIGLDKIIYSRPSEQWARDSLAMIIGRVVFAGSKLALTSVHKDSALWDLSGHMGKDSIDVNKHCYAAMDKLLARQAEIQKKLAIKHLKEGSIVLYDITSSYFEGNYTNSEIIKYGYNRDKKQGKKQIVIGLICSKDGCPIAVEVFRGNTKDETTVMSKIKELRETYGFKNLVLVGDRGILTRSQLEKIDSDRIINPEDDYIKIISALTHNEIKKLCDTGPIQLSLFDERDVVEIICPDTKMRYGLCINPHMRAKEAATRTALLTRTKEAMDKIALSTRNNSKEQLGIRVGKVINKYGMGKFVKILEIADKRLVWAFDNEKIENEAKLDGCYVIRTDVSAEDMSISEAVNNYKNLMKVEAAFRSMKSVQLELRPFYHRNDERIAAHVFICMLAYYIMWHIKNRLQHLFAADVDGKNQKYTFEYIIRRLKNIRKNTVSFCGAETEIIDLPDGEQNIILTLLGVVI